MRLPALLAVVLVAGACSGGVSQDELDSIADERNLAQVRLTESQVAVARLEERVMTLEERLLSAEMQAEITDGIEEEAAAEADRLAFWVEFLRRYDDAWSSGDLDRVLPFYDRDVRYEIPVRGTVRRGRDDVFLSFTNFLGGLGEYRQETRDFGLLADRTALVMWEATGRGLGGELVLLSGGTRLELDDDDEIIRQTDYLTLP